MSSADAAVGTSNRWDTTTWNASPARISSTAALDGVPEPGPAAAAQVDRRGPVAGDGQRGRGLGEVALHRVQPRDRVGPGLVDPLVGGVVVDRVGDEQHRAVLVVEHGQVGGEQHGQLGQVQVVLGLVGQPLQPADRVVPEEADHATGQRRQVGQPRRCAAARACRAARPAGRRPAGTPTGGVPVQTAEPSARSGSPPSAPRRRSTATTPGRARRTPAGRCPGAPGRAGGTARPGCRRRRAADGSPGSRGGPGPAAGKPPGPVWQRQAAAGMADSLANTAAEPGASRGQTLPSPPRGSLGSAPTVIVPRHAVR